MPCAWHPATKGRRLSWYIAAWYTTFKVCKRDVGREREIYNRASMIICPPHLVYSHAFSPTSILRSLLTLIRFPTKNGVYIASYLHPATSSWRSACFALTSYRLAFPSSSRARCWLFLSEVIRFFSPPNPPPTTIQYFSVRSGNPTNLATKAKYLVIYTNRVQMSQLQASSTSM